MAIAGAGKQQRCAVQKGLEEVVAASQVYLQHVSEDVDNDAKSNLMMKATRLVQTLRGPVPLALTHFENIVHMAALRTLMEAGVFHTIPKGGTSMTAAEISSRTGLDKNILIRLMRAVTPSGPFQETGEEEYAHTPYSEAYMSPDISGCFPLMADFVFGPILQTCEFLRRSGWKDTITTRNNPFTVAHNCPGETMFEYLYKNGGGIPRVTNAEAADPEQMAMDPYPWEEELGSHTSKDSVVLVDIGGSHGNASRRIKELAPGLKGRFFLQDLEAVITENEKALNADAIETMTYDFLQQVQPIQGAAAYYFRRIFHDWPDAPESQQILRNTAAAMDHDRSRILIHDIIVPEVGATMSHAWQDLSLMAVGGTERTAKDFSRLLDDAGLRLVKIWRKSGDMMGVVEARLK